MRPYDVYILASLSRVLYTGGINDLERRMWEHRHGPKGFVARYRVNRLVYYDTFTRIDETIEWEKRIKSWRRSRKVALIASANPEWEDLSARWESGPAS